MKSSSQREAMLFDFVVLGLTTEKDADPRTCLLGSSFFNPRRAMTTTCLLSSNHGHVSGFVLVDERQEDASRAEEELELKKEALRKARRERATRNVIVYSWPVIDPRLTTITTRKQPSDDCTSTPLDDADKRPARTWRHTIRQSAPRS